MTTEVIDTPDIQSFRGFTPNLAMLRPALDAQMNTELRNVRDDYGAYSGIPSQVSRLALKRRGENDVYRNRALALAEGNESNQRLKMAQLESLANLTAKRHQYGYTSGFPGAGGGLGGLLGGIGGAAGGAAAVIGAL